MLLGYNKLSYLDLNSGNVEMKDTDAKLVSEYGDCSIASIGTAGERLVKFACINVDWSRKGNKRYALCL